jgi:hypothetical protein
MGKFRNLSLLKITIDTLAMWSKGMEWTTTYEQENVEMDRKKK